MAKKKTLDAVITNEGPFKGWTVTRFLDWLKDQPPDFQEAFNKALLQRPDVVVKAVKTLRWIASDPNAPSKLRKEAQRDLKARGYDDESLKEEDEG